MERWADQPDTGRVGIRMQTGLGSNVVGECVRRLAVLQQALSNPDVWLLKVPTELKAALLARSASGGIDRRRRMDGAKTRVIGRLDRQIP